MRCVVDVDDLEVVDELLELMLEPGMEMLYCNL